MLWGFYQGLGILSGVDLRILQECGDCGGSQIQVSRFGALGLGFRAVQKKGEP